MHSDFRGLLSAFNDHGVEYLIVDAHALAAHGHVRATMDMDVWVRASPENAARTMRALAVFGAPLQDLTAADLSRPGIVFQIGIAPLRIDVLTAIDGVDFEDAWENTDRNVLPNLGKGNAVAGVHSISHAIMWTGEICSSGGPATPVRSSLIVLP